MAKRAKLCGNFCFAVYLIVCVAINVDGQVGRIFPDVTKLDNVLPPTVNLTPFQSASVYINSKNATGLSLVPLEWNGSNTTDGMGMNFADGFNLTDITGNSTTNMVMSMKLAVEMALETLTTFVKSTLQML